jgi:predicted DNA-binding transcriptional regulator AlpA
MQYMLTTNEVMAALGIKSRMTLYKMVKAGNFPSPVRFGRQNAWFDDSVRTFLANKRKASEANVGSRRGQRRVF